MCKLLLPTLALLLQLQTAAAASALPRSVVLGGSRRPAQLRVSVLSDRVLRVETAQGDANAPPFEDRASLTFSSREALPVSQYSSAHTAGSTVWRVTTKDLTLRYDTAQLGDHAVNGGAAATLGCAALNISMNKPTGTGTSWWCPGSTYKRPGTSPFWPGQELDEWHDIVHGPPGNLNGSLDSTDCYHGAIPCISVYGARQQAGLFSREGWSIVDDAQTALVLNSTVHDRWSQRGARSGAMDVTTTSLSHTPLPPHTPPQLELRGASDIFPALSVVLFGVGHRLQGWNEGIYQPGWQDTDYAVACAWRLVRFAIGFRLICD